MNEKRLSSIGICLVLLFGTCCAEKTKAPQEQREKESYSLGFRFGENMKFQGTELDLDIYMTGLRDALEGKQARMTEEEMRTTISLLQQRMASAQQKAQKEKTEKNLHEGKAFLEENGKKEGVTTLPSGLQYKVVSEGSGRTPQKSDTVTVHYSGMFIDGNEFDSSADQGQTQSFRVDGVIAGWTEALQLMKVGAKWKLFIPSGLAYGERGIPGRIPPNSTLIFEIELVSIQ